MKSIIKYNNQVKLIEYQKKKKKWHLAHNIAHVKFGKKKKKDYIQDRIRPMTRQSRMKQTTKDWLNRTDVNRRRLLNRKFI